MSKKKICFIAQFPPPMHGLSKAVDTLYNSELAQEYEFEKVDITNNKKILSTLRDISKSKANIFYFTISQTKGGNLRDLVILKLLEMQKKKCLIHLHGGYYRTLVDSIGGWQAKANFKAISKLAGAIVLGPSLKWIFEGMLPEDKLYTVPNCVDDQYLMDGKSFQHKIDTIEQREVKHVLYLSNFIRTKGYPKVLEMAKLEKDRVDAGGERKLHFDFAGKFFEESEKQFFENYIEKYVLEDYVTYHGIVGGKEKQILLKQCDFFALLTTYPNEGQPISILEAMGNGMVVLTTDHAGIPDIVIDGVNGIVLNKNDVDIEKLYQRLQSFKDEEIKRIELRNRNSVIQKYRQQEYICNMKDVFGKTNY